MKNVMNKNIDFTESSKIILSIAAVVILLFIESGMVKSDGKPLVSWNNETYGLIDSAGKEIVPVKYNRIYYVGYGIFWLSEKSKEPILLNRAGALLSMKVPAGTRFDRVLWLGASVEANKNLMPDKLADDALLVYRDNRNIGVCDKNGLVVLQPNYIHIGYVSEHLAIIQSLEKRLFIFDVRTHKCQSISDEVICSDMDMSFSDGLARFKSGDLFGFIDTSGNVVIKPNPEYKWRSYGFTDGLACIDKLGTDGKTHFCAVVNKAGEVVSPSNSNIEEFWGDFAVAAVAGKRGVVNRQFKFVIQPDYDFLLAQEAPYYTIDDIYSLRRKPPLFFYAMKTKGEPPVVLSTDGKVLFDLPKGMSLPYCPPHVHDGVIDCPVWTGPNSSKSLYLDMNGNEIAHPFPKIPNMPYVRVQEIAPGILIKAVSPREQPTTRTY